MPLNFAGKNSLKVLKKFFIVNIFIVRFFSSNERDCNIANATGWHSQKLFCGSFKNCCVSSELYTSTFS